MYNLSDDYILNSDLKYIETATCIEDYEHYIAKCNIETLMPLLDSNRPRDNTYNLNTNNLVNENKPYLTTYTSSNYIELKTNNKEGKSGDTFNIAFVSGDINKLILV